MSKSNNGGPAFPIQGQQFDIGEGPMVIPGNNGMTLRDYFAAKAMLGYFSSPEELSASQIAGLAYVFADAMLEARAA